MGDIVECADYRLSGARSPVSARVGTRILLANPARLTVVNAAISGSAPNVNAAQLLVQSESAALSAAPMSMAANTSYVFALGANLLARVVNDATLDTASFALTSYPVVCSNTSWLVCRGGFVYFPFQEGGVQVYTTGGVFVARYAGLVSQSDFAVVDASRGILYLLDGHKAEMAVFAMASDGTLSAYPTVLLSNCRGIVGADLGSDYLAVATPHRLTLFSLDDRTAPSHFETIAFSQYHVNSVVGVGVNKWWLSTDEYLSAQEDRFNYPNSSAVFIVGKGVFALSSKTGRLIGEADFVSTVPGSSGDVVVDETFRILQEDGSLLLTEDGSILIQE